MTEINTTIKKELLSRAEIKKLYLMTNLTDIAQTCNVESSEVTLTIQKMFLTSDTDFTYDLSETRSGVKIVALDSYSPKVETSMKLAENPVDLELAKYILSQFESNVSFDDMKRIIMFYKTLLNCSDKVQLSSDDILYFAIIKENDHIYKQINKGNTKMHPMEIDSILSLIIKYGYAFEKDNHIFWKTYSPNAIITEQDAIDAFTVKVKPAFKEESIKQPVKESIEEEQKEIVKSDKLIEEPLTVSKAFNFLAKELGMALDENESKHKLEEMVAMTNELVINFNELQDWEKLKSWDKFVQNWQTIMGEAINDRN